MILMKKQIMSNRYSIFIGLSALLFFFDLFTTYIALPLTKTVYEVNGIKRIMYVEEANSLFQSLLNSLGIYAYPIAFSICLLLVFSLYGLHSARALCSNGVYEVSSDV